MTRKPEHSRYEICVVIASLLYILHIENTWIFFLCWQAKICMCSYEIRETDKGTTRSVKTFSRNEDKERIPNREKINHAFRAMVISYYFTKACSS